MKRRKIISEQITINDPSDIEEYRRMRRLESENDDMMDIDNIQSDERNDISEMGNGFSEEFLKGIGNIGKKNKKKRKIIRKVKKT